MNDQIPKLDIPFITAHIKRVETLFREIMRQHADPNAPEYNGCDVEPCYWCVQTAEIISSADIESPPTNEPKVNYD